jgi:hypothetical protein
MQVVMNNRCGGTVKEKQVDESTHISLKERG